ncbi:MAG TPA: POTRA domain-containing protein, partial [Desulfomonilia bacterium]|nr:POTRA domain-containing protein [Desulfomonilia bacterium]
SFERFEDGIGITLALKPSLIVKDIVIQGAYPLFESDVLKSMSIYVGDAFLPDTFSEQEKLIGELYRKEGYKAPRIRVTKGEVVGGTVKIDVDIRAGDYYYLDSLTISGNRAITDTELKSRMNSWRQSYFIRESGRFLEYDLAQDIKDIRSLYWQRGYPECKIDYSLQRDEQKLTVSAVVNITEGPKYKVSIKGNSHFWTYTLKQDMVIFSEGYHRDRGLGRTIGNIVDRYRRSGFLFTRVEALEEKETMGSARSKTIELHITEGPRTLVDAVLFTGNTVFTKEKLKKAMQTGNASFLQKEAFVPEALDEDIETLKALYLKDGYNKVEITPKVDWKEDKTGVSVTLKIHEGVRTMVTTLRIDGLMSIPEKKALASMGLRVGRPFRDSLVRSDEAALAELVSGKGHPYVKVRGEATLSEDRTRADVVFHVDEGQFVTMGNIYYRGNFDTRKSVVRRELEIESGEPFSLKTMLEGQKKIRDMQAFDSVQFKTMGLKEGHDKVTLLVDMEEIKPYYYQAGLGYVTDRGFYGNAKVGDRNLFGLNKHAWLGGEVSQIGYRGDLNLTQQRIFGAPVLNTYTLSYERKEEFNQIFGTSVATSAINFLWEYEPRITTSLGFRYELRDQFLQDSSSTIPEGEEDAYDPRGILVITPFISYDSRNSFVRPLKGTYSSYSVDISKGYQSSLDNFLKHYVNLRFYYSPWRRITFAWLGRFGYIDPFGEASSIPEDQLFYLGGTLSVRGFDENKLRFDANGDPVGGRLSMAGSMEARIELT